MANATTTTTTTNRKAATATAKAATAPTTTTTTAPTGATTTTAVGTSQGEVPALAHVVALLGVALAQPGAAWPGYGKAVRLAGGGSMYVNRGNVDVRATPGLVAQWAKAGLGTARGPQGQYLRVLYSSTGTAH